MLRNFSPELFILLPDLTREATVALAGIPAGKIIPAMDCWEDQEIMRLDGRDSNRTDRGGCDGVMEWLPKYCDRDELCPYEKFIVPPECPRSNQE